MLIAYSQRQFACPPRACDGFAFIPAESAMIRTPKPLMRHSTSLQYRRDEFLSCVFSICNPAVATELALPLVVLIFSTLNWQFLPGSGIAAVSAIRPKFGIAWSDFTLL